MEKLSRSDPRQIGAYRLLARLGAGGMGQVFLARSPRGRVAAVKLVRPELASNEEFRARFRQEVAAARQVGGPWTAPVLDADTEAEVPWVATGYVPGRPLHTVVAHDHGPLPERSVRVLAAGLASALIDIHAAGLVHRDLKPSNILVTIDGPRVIDFGIARALESVSDSLTRTGVVVGSPGFMAPEQVNGDPVTPACDIFCLGSVLAFAALGRPPFGSNESSPHAVMFRIAQGEPRLDGIPEGLVELVADCLNKDPAARPTPDALVERSGVRNTVADGRSCDPWLPVALVGQLGRHANRLLETEDPGDDEHASASGTGPGRPSGSGAEGAAEDGPETRGTGAAAGDAKAGAPPEVPRPPGPAPSVGTGAPADEATRTSGTSGTGPRGPAPPPAFPPHHPPTVPVAHPPPPGPPGVPPGAFVVGPEPVRDGGRRRAGTLLVVGAVVVALATVGTVYLMRYQGGPEADGGTTPSPSRSVSASEDPEESPGADPSRTSDPAPPSRTPDGASSSAADRLIPEAYLGVWNSGIDTAAGHSTRRLTIRQGGVGDTVLSLAADGPLENGGTYHCLFEAELEETPHGDGPLRMTASHVVEARPASSCNTPTSGTTVRLLSDGRLRRTDNGDGRELTYTKAR